jgi:hypothetical protein
VRAFSLGATRRLAKACDLREYRVILEHPCGPFPPRLCRVVTKLFPHLTQFSFKLGNACFQSQNGLVSFHGTFLTSHDVSCERPPKPDRQGSEKRR